MMIMDMIMIMMMMMMMMKITSSNTGTEKLLQQKDTYIFWVKNIKILREVQKNNILKKAFLPGLACRQ